MRFNRRRFLNYGAQAGAFLGLGGLGMLQGCDDPEKSGEQSGRTTEASAMPKMVMQNSWINDAEFLGYFIGIEDKIYDKHGLELSYLPGGPQIIPEASLLNGDADIALTTPETTAQIIAKDKVELRIIGAQYRVNPIGIVSIVHDDEEKNITKLTDLIGKRLAVAPVNLLTVEAVLKKNQIDKNQIQFYPYKYDPRPLIEGQVDATVDFTTNVPFTIEKKSGKKTQSISLYDVGFPIYNDTVVVTEQTYQNRRTDLINWLRASREAWEIAAKDGGNGPALAYIDKFMEDPKYFKDNGRSAELEKEFNRRQIKLMKQPGGFFDMTPDDITANIEALKLINLELDRNVFAADLVEQAKIPTKS